MRINRHELVVILATFFILGLGVSCSSDENGGSSGTEATLTHDPGFDFSEGTDCDDDDYTNDTCDGDAFGFNPNIAGTAESTEENPLVWWRSWVDEMADPTQTKDLGEIDLGDVTEDDIPATWPDEPDPIVEGHVYITKCQDGYAAFYVVALSDDPYNDWDFDVRYIYSEDGTF